MQISLSEDQEKARDAIVAHVRGQSGPLLTVAGYAGTGKTTVMSESVRSLGEARAPLAFCAYSGKAAAVMRSKLELSGSLRPGDYCGTIHGLIYNLTGAWLKQSKKGKEYMAQIEKPAAGVRTPIKERLEMDMQFEATGLKAGYQAIMVDEGSMVGEEVFNDISAMGLPVVVFGDHGQLPPVKSSFNLMQHPMIRLEKIHRQAEKSPIIKMSMLAREEGRIPIGDYSDRVRKIRMSGDLSWSKALTKDWVMLCGRNATRIFWNNRLRNQYGFQSHDVETGERVICLKNNKELGIYNGMMGIVRSVMPSDDHWYKMVAEMDGGVTFAGDCLTHQFGSQSTLYEYPPAALSGNLVMDLFDWAWCITAHKSQGSEFESVCVLEERMGGSDDDWRKWLYTVVTRAKENLIVVGA